MNRLALHSFRLILLAALLEPAIAQEVAPPAKPADAAAAQGATTPAASAEPDRVPAELEQRYEHMKNELQKDLPQREIKITSVPPVKERFFGADPKLFENKFVAYFVLRPPGVDLRSTESINAYNERLGECTAEVRHFPEPLRAIGADHNHYLYYPHPKGTGTSDPAVFFKLLAQSCPLENHPDKRLVEFLTSPNCARDVRLYGERVDKRSSVQDLNYRVFAPTAEVAEARAKAIVRLYDLGYSRPMQKYLLTKGEKALDESRGCYAALAPLPALIKAEREKLTQPTEISDAILTELKAQKVMVAIEVAGLNARVKACDAALKDLGKLEISTLQSISDMKVKAEIERVGIKEKLDQITKFIAEGDARQAASSQWQNLSLKRKELRGAVQRSESLAAYWAEMFKLCAPFEIIDNQITVGPIEWTQQ